MLESPGPSQAALRAELQKRMTEAAGFIRKAETVRAALADADSAGDVLPGAEDRGELVRAWETKTLLLTHRAFLKTIDAYLDSGGGSRGAYLVAAAGEVHSSQLTVDSSELDVGRSTLDVQNPLASSQPPAAGGDAETRRRGDTQNSLACSDPGRVTGEGRGEGSPASAISHHPLAIGSVDSAKGVLCKFVKERPEDRLRRVKITGPDLEVSWEDVRPLPSDDSWFETVWAEWRRGAVLET